MLSITNYTLQYSNVDYAAVVAAAPQLFITEAAPLGGSPALTDTQVASLVAAGTKVVGYVESSVTDAGRPYWNSAWTSDGTDTGTVLSTAPAWLKSGVTNPFGVVADIREAAWRQIVIDQAVDLVTRGYSGVFLDDVAQYYALGQGNVTNTQNFAMSMLTLVSEVKAAIVTINPNAVVIVNSTPYIVTDAVGGITSTASQDFLNAADGLMLESFFGINRAPEEAGIAQAVAAISPSMTVLSLEFGGTAYQNFQYGNQATAKGFVPGYSTTAAYNTLIVARADASDGNDALLGTNRADSINGKSGNDTISAGDGDDSIIGGTGSDTVLGGAGQDVILVGNGLAGDFDVLDGGIDRDLLDMSGLTNGGIWIDYGYNVISGPNMASGFNLSMVVGEARVVNMDSMVGTSFGDTMRGDAGSNLIDGGAGNDILLSYSPYDTITPYSSLGDVMLGGSGDDLLFSGTGNDYLDGGANNDTLEVGGGTDTVVTGTGNDTIFFSPRNGTDTVTDFTGGAGVVDVLKLYGFGTSFDTFAEVFAVSSQVGANTQIALTDTTIILQNFTRATLVADDFVFV
jgi:uncharacterized protein (TIGR01370 family)